MLTKLEYETRLGTSIEKSLEAVSTIIDNRLLKDNKTINISDIKKIVDENKIEVLITKIIKEYTAVGWKVERINGYDQRDNDSWDYLTFS